MRRFSLLGVMLNVAAIALLAATGVALADDTLPAQIAGSIGGALDPNAYYTNAFIDGVDLYMPGGGSSVFSAVNDVFLAVFATFNSISGLLSSSSAAAEQLVDYVLQSDVLNALTMASSSSASPNDTLAMYAFVADGSGGTTAQLDGLSFNVPEPNAIALLVTATSGIAAAVGRRRLRRVRP